MAHKVTIEYEDLPQELSALEQPHNAGQPAVSVGYQAVDPASAETVPALSDAERKHQEKHPEDFQLHNAGRPAVVTGGGNELTTPQEWDLDPEAH